MKFRHNHPSLIKIRYIYLIWVAIFPHSFLLQFPRKSICLRSITHFLDRLNASESTKTSPKVYNLDYIYLYPFMLLMGLLGSFFLFFICSQLNWKKFLKEVDQGRIRSATLSIRIIVWWIIRRYYKRCHIKVRLNPENWEVKFCLNHESTNTYRTGTGHWLFELYESYE